MGVVWAAEQKRPLHRKVALKVIKPGMDTSQVIARFEAERGALAMMEHPNIARVLDAGTTDHGRPYFVMELICGAPITEYCDANKLSIRERLELFVQVCRAVQHAHQKGIIHRDLKPSNVLVTQHDDRPVPKVIDFGVAKALHHSLTDRSIYTGVFQAVGTLAYMSPEQAQLSGLNVDTRADVYGLGALLYELLTGAAPFDQNDLASAAFDEACRMIGEKDPIKPSNKISTLGEHGRSISEDRKTDVTGLGRTIRGELDWIVMKCLEKDRTHRYDTATGLADDVVRFLKNEPVVARSASLLYRAKKFASRNRAAVVATTLVLASLISGILLTSWMAVTQHRTAEEKSQLLSELERTAADLAQSSYSQATMAAMAGDTETASELLSAVLKGDPGEADYRRNVLEGLIAFDEGRYEGAIDYAHDALEAGPSQKSPEKIAAHAILGLGYWWTGDVPRFKQKLEELWQAEPRTDTDHLLLAHIFVLNCRWRTMQLITKTAWCVYELSEKLKTLNTQCIASAVLAEPVCCFSVPNVFKDGMICRRWPSFAMRSHLNTVTARARDFQWLTWSVGRKMDTRKQKS